VACYASIVQILVNKEYVRNIQYPYTLPLKIEAEGLAEIDQRNNSPYRKECGGIKCDATKIKGPCIDTDKLNE
jgi:hypothetical protein